MRFPGVPPTQLRSPPHLQAETTSAMLYVLRLPAISNYTFTLRGIFLDERVSPRGYWCRARMGPKQRLGRDNPVG